MNINIANINFYKYMAIAIAFFVLANALRHFKHLNPQFTEIAFLLIFVIYIAILSAWSLSIIVRVMHKHIRFYLAAIAFLMILWVFLRSMKCYPIVFYGGFERWLWYCYYIPIILIPLLSFLVSTCVGRPENWKPHNEYHYLFLPAFVLIGLVLANDFHQKTFSFNENFSHWDDTYAYGIIYYLVIAWILGFVLISLRNLYVKSYIPYTKKRIFMPLVIVAAGALYCVLYIIEPSAQTITTYTELTPMLCFFIAITWEAVIQTGLLPSNTNHHIFLNNSTLQIQILGENKRRYYGSFQAHNVDSNVFEALKVENNYELDKNTILHSWPINGGYVVWEEDISDIVKIIDELNIKREKLRIGLDILKKEIHTKALHAHISEQNRLYDLIFTHVSPQLSSVKKIMDHARTSTLEEQEKLLKELNLLGVHIKRKSNLLLINESGEFVASEELSYSLREIFESLKAWGVKSTIMKKLNDTIDLKFALVFLDFFVQIVRDFIEELSGVYVSLFERDDTISLTIQIENSKASPDTGLNIEIQDTINNLGGVVITENQEHGLIYFALHMPKGGDGL